LKHLKLLGSIAVVVVIVIGIIGYLFSSGYVTSWYSQDGKKIWGYHVFVRNIELDSAKPNTLLADAYFISNPGRTVAFTTAIIRNSTHHVIAEGSVFPNVLPTNTTMKLIISLNQSLPSGTYNIYFPNEVAGEIISSPFTIPS